jgi:CDGSH-type Zn-finger protein
VAGRAISRSATDHIMGSGFAPVQFTVDERKQLWLCGCKQTGTAPYCDGTHKSL